MHHVWSIQPKKVRKFDMTYRILSQRRVVLLKTRKHLGNARLWRRQQRWQDVFFCWWERFFPRNFGNGSFFFVWIKKNRKIEQDIDKNLILLSRPIFFFCENATVTTCKTCDNRDAIASKFHPPSIIFPQNNSGDDENADQNMLCRSSKIVLF